MTAGRRVTITDVAAAAGVSLTTVSDSLTGKGRIPDETRARVKQVADELGYRPNALAQQLRGPGLGLIGFLIAPAAEATMTTVWFWNTLMNHATEAALGRQHALVLLPYDAELLRSRRLPVDGAIVVDPKRGDEVTEVLRATGMPIITVGRDLDHPSEPWVDDDYVNGASELLDRAVAAGEHVAMITLAPTKSYIHDSIVGAQQWAERTGSRVSLHTVSAFSAEQLDPALDAILDADPADAILALNDRLATALLRRLRARGVNVPGEVRLVCVCDSPELGQSRPTITAARQHPEDVGRIAVSAIIDAIAGRDIAESTLVPMDVMPRTSAPALSAPTKRRPKR